MLCETKPEDNMQHRDTAEAEKLEDTVPLLKKNHLNHHIYQDIFYNNVNMCENLLQRKNENFWHHRN
jgi:hypothetical protein